MCELLQKEETKTESGKERKLNVQKCSEPYKLAIK